MYAAVVFNLHLNWLLMAFCRLNGSRTEKAAERRRIAAAAAVARASGNSQILKRPRERVAELLPGSMYRRRCFFAGYERPRERSASERARERENGRREKEGGREPAAMLFLFTHPLYQHSESRTPEGIRQNERTRERTRRESLVHFRAAKFRKFDQTPRRCFIGCFPIP